MRYLEVIGAESDQPPQFNVGVAFIGKECPTGHDSDPAQRYAIQSNDGESGLWKLQEPSSPDPGGAPSGERRREARHEIADEVVVEIYDASGTVYTREVTATENISRHGMSVITTLHIVRGRYVRVRSSRYAIAVIAAVRRLGQVGDGRKRLHLEFVDQEWPPL